MSSVELGMPLVRATPGSTLPTRPDDPRLIDTFGRVAGDLRVSLTDRCNLRCSYCMPAEGLDWTPTEQLLTDAEIIRLVRVGVDRLGIRGVRFTGGEPLLRKGLVDIVDAVAAMRTPAGAPVDTALTTNGIGLDRRAEPLARAGLRRINVSLDTLRRNRFEAITRRDRIDDVFAGLAAARSAGLDPIKVNSVLVRGINEDEVPDLLTWALREGFQLRVIEQMPLDAQGQWDREAMITSEHVLASLAGNFVLTPHQKARRGAAPAATYSVAAGKDHPAGVFGMVSSVTRPFCGDCDRTRLTGDGMVRNCLFAREESDLRALLRGGAGDEEIAQAWRAAMWVKKPGHGIDDPSFVQPDRPMSSIGG